MKLKYKEIKDYRQQQLEQQQFVCSLCNDYIEDDAVLDHDHKTGLIRCVLHRGCNALLGKIENNMARNRMSIERLEHWASNLVGYINSTHTELTHPTYKEKTMPGRGRGRGKKPPKR
jgi:hypothetical protein